METEFLIIPNKRSQYLNKFIFKNNYIILSLEGHGLKTQIFKLI